MEMTFRVSVAARKGVSGELRQDDGSTESASALSVSGKPTIADTGLVPQYLSTHRPRRRFPSVSSRLLRRACSPTTLEKKRKSTS